MPISSGYVSWKLQYNITPIILTGGIATSLGGALPIVTLIQGGGDAPSSQEDQLPDSPGGSNDATLDDYFAQFKVLPGAKLNSFAIGTYPLANQAIAGNAIIQQPTSVSMLMTVPATADFPFSVKSSTMTALKNSIDQHCSLGGTFSVMTPSFVYTYATLLDIYDVGGDDENPQAEWRWDFFCPLISQQEANTAQNGLMQKLTDQTAISGTPTWTPAGLPVANSNSLIDNSGAPYLGGVTSGAVSQLGLQ